MISVATPLIAQNLAFAQGDLFYLQEVQAHNQLVNSVIILGVASGVCAAGIIFLIRRKNRTKNRESSKI